jgi:hypothetical protein
MRSVNEHAKNPLIQSVVKRIRKQKKETAHYSVPDGYKSTLNSFMQAVRRNLRREAKIIVYDRAKRSFVAKIKED